MQPKLISILGEISGAEDEGLPREDEPHTENEIRQEEAIGIYLLERGYINLIE